MKNSVIRSSLAMATAAFLSIPIGANTASAGSARVGKRVGQRTPGVRNITTKGIDTSPLRGIGASPSLRTPGVRATRSRLSPGARTPGVRTPGVRAGSRK